MIRKWDIDNKMVNQKCADEVTARIQDIDDPTTVGIIAAQDVIDIVLENMAPEIYNKAVNDAIKLLRDKFQEIEYSTEDLKQS